MEISQMNPNTLTTEARWNPVKQLELFMKG